VKKQFALNTEPHVAEIGDEIRLEFQPEVMGDAFLDAYEGLRERYNELGIDLDNLAGTAPGTLREAYATLRAFLASLMLPSSAEAFARWEVHAGGEVAGVYTDPVKAAEHAERLNEEAGPDVAEVVDASMPLPDRVLVGLMEWVLELYGGGRPPTSSTGSSAASPPRGSRGTGTSRSKASTRARGR
jgi:hypothetical protein